MNATLRRLRGTLPCSANDRALMAFAASFIPPSADVQERNDMNFDTWKIGRDGLLVFPYLLVHSSVRIT